MVVGESGKGKTKAVGLRQGDKKPIVIGMLCRNACVQDIRRLRDAWAGFDLTVEEGLKQLAGHCLTNQYACKLQGYFWRRNMW